MMTKRELWERIKRDHATLADELRSLKQAGFGPELIELQIPGHIYKKEDRGPSMLASRWLHQQRELNEHHMTQKERDALSQARDHIKRHRDDYVDTSNRQRAGVRRNRRARTVKN